MILGCLLLVILLSRYEFKTTISAVWPAATSVLAAAPESTSPVIRGILRT